MQALLPPGAARNALDCALWDLEAKRTGVPAHVCAGLAPPRARHDRLHISLDAPEAMARGRAHARRDRPILKIKLGGDGGRSARIAAVRRGRARCDAHRRRQRGLDAATTSSAISRPAPQAGVALIEQPLPAGDDGCLARHRAAGSALRRRERARPRTASAALAGLYDAVNIKLDKTGGLTEALALAERRGARLRA